MQIGQSEIFLNDLVIWCKKMQFWPPFWNFKVKAAILIFVKGLVEFVMPENI
jgi:hypothetical protein